MKIVFSEKKKAALFYCFSTLLLFFGFFSNSWGVAEPEWFKDHQIVMQSFIIGRIVLSRQEGIFSRGGLTGIGSPDVTPPDIENANYRFQYQAYLENLPFRNFSVYESQIGGQGVLFSILDAVLPFPPETKFPLFLALTALLSAILLAFVAQWFYREFSFFVALLVLLSEITSQWLVVFGRNLWWSLWAFYLPMAMVMWFLSRRRKPGGNSVWKFGLVVFTGVFLKCLFNGYEYMTTTLIMMMIPYLYHCASQKAGWRRFLGESLVAVCVSLAAMLLSMAILCVQIASVEGSLQKGIEHIVFSLQRRTYADPQAFPADYASSLNADTVAMVATYLKGVYFDLNNYLPVPDGFVSRYLFPVRYVSLILLFAAASILLFASQRGRSWVGTGKDLALILAAWASILAPLSWFIIFRAHSFIHTHMNFVVWQMPFTLFGFAVCGAAVRNLVHSWKSRMIQKKESSPLIEDGKHPASGS
jgi:hypothetical protein